MSKHIFLAAAMAFVAIGSPAHAEDIVVGAPNSVTGGFAEASVRAVAGLQLAIDKINADGGIKALGGAKLKSIVVDTSDSNPTQAATVTRRLIAEDKAVVLFGSGASAMTLSTQVEAERAEVPLISPSYADPIVQRGYKYTFKIPMQASQVIDRSLGYLVDLMKAETGTVPKTMAVFSGSDAASQAIHKVIEDIAKKHDISITTKNSYQQGLSDPTAIISAARGNPADVIYLGANDRRFSRHRTRIARCWPEVTDFDRGRCAVQRPDREGSRKRCKRRNRNRSLEF